MRDRLREGWREKRETREEVKCNRGFIVCGSLGRERRREKGAGRGEETGRRETVGTARWQRPQRQADLQTEASRPNKQRYNQTNAAQETASALETKLRWHKIKRSAIRRLSALRSHTDCTQNTHTQACEPGSESDIWSWRAVTQNSDISVRKNVENINSPGCRQSS